MKTDDIDLWDVIEDIEDEIEAIDGNIEDTKAEIAEADDENLEQALYNTADDLFARRDEWAELKSITSSRLEEAVEEDGWEDTTFGIKELSVADQAQIQDRSGRNLRNGDELPQGAAQISMMQAAITDTPEGAPDDPADLPMALGQLVNMAVGKLSGQDPFDGEGPEKGGNEEFRQEVRARAN